MKLITHLSTVAVAAVTAIAAQAQPGVGSLYRAAATKAYDLTYAFGEKSIVPRGAQAWARPLKLEQVQVHGTHFTVGLTSAAARRLELMLDSVSGACVRHERR
jgi:hypothetical protein